VTYLFVSERAYRYRADVFWGVAPPIFALPTYPGLPCRLIAAEASVLSGGLGTEDFLDIYSKNRVPLILIQHSNLVF